MLVIMIDSIESPQTTGNPIPQAILHGAAVAGYSYGNSWPTAPIYARARPDLARKGYVVTISLSVVGLTPNIARCGDFEPGGMANRDVHPFLEVADARDGLPWLYTYAANGAALLQQAAWAGYKQGTHFYYWSAHTGMGPHVCAPNVCGYPTADGTQYGYEPENCDISLINDYMLPSQPAPVELQPEDSMITSTTDKEGNVHVFVEVPHSKDDPTQGSTVYECYQTDGTHWAGGMPNVRKAQAFPLARIPQDVA